MVKGDGVEMREAREENVGQNGRVISKKKKI